MSPVATACTSATTCFPRVSGDEPFHRLSERGAQMFSPRERG